MHRIDEYTRVLFTLWSALTIACSDPVRSTADRHCDGSRTALYGGAPDSAGAGVDDAVAGGVIFSTADDAEFCTMTRLAPGWMLTARHCIDPASRWVELTFGPDFLAAKNAIHDDDDEPARCAVPSESGAVSTLTSSALLQVVVHEHLDLALLRLELPDGPSLPVTTSAAFVSEPVLLVGYGTQESGDGGAQELLWGTVARVEHDLVVVTAVDGGACLGDSGGPLLRQTEGGAFELVGVLSTGSASCVAGDNYVDVTRAADWLAESVRAR